MAHVGDVAAYILEQQGEMPAMKLQKLVFYAHAWSLVWDEAPLFEDHIEAWANGPVVPALYAQHRGKFRVRRDDISGDPSVLSACQRESVNAVLDHYAKQTSQWLSELTHAEPPWRDARAGLQPGERGSSPITDAAMAEYYGGL